MTAAEMRQRQSEELRSLQDEMREDLFRLKMQHYTGQLDRVSRLKETRRDIARIQTILRERELAERQ